MLWAAITGASILGIGFMAFYTLGIVARGLQFFQPVLVPIAFAGILAYLLDPLVQKLARRGVPRFRAVLWVWSGFHIFMLVLFVLVAVPTISKGSRLISANSHRWVESIGELVSKTLEGVDDLAARFNGLTLHLRGNNPPEEAPLPQPAPAEDPPPVLAIPPEMVKSGTVSLDDAPPEDVPVVAPVKQETAVTPRQSAKYVQRWLEAHSEEISQRVIGWLRSGLEGFLGLFGYIVGFILIPVYLYYFLKESDSIKNNWSNYIPLRASRFKAEVVDVLDEINSYLIAFFRGQMLVSLIDGLLVGISLAIIGLPYSMLIGVFVAILGLIPYVGNFLCWFAAVMVSLAHFGRTDEAGELVNTFAGIQSLWVYPVLVTVLFVVVQQVNSIVTAPRIVGDAVGLHPLTVIFSVLFWSLLIGGLLGALLAVPLTAAVKVLFRRYIWERKVQPRFQSAA